MTQKSQKIITIGLVSLAVIGGFQALIYVVNLNQVKTFLLLGLAIWLYLWIKVTLLYDLHFKEAGVYKKARLKHANTSYMVSTEVKVFFTALWDRLLHFRRVEMFATWANYLLLPGLIFWATAGLLFLNMGKVLPQQIYAAISSLSLIVAFWYIKEIYTRKEERVSLDIFAALSAVKIYSVLIVFASSLTLTRYFDLEPHLFFLGVLCLTFLIMCQAILQHKHGSLKNLNIALLISGVQSFLALWVYWYWGYNNLTGALFLTAFYNMFWGIFHHTLEGTLNKRVFWETVIVSLFIAMLSVSATNFKAQLHGI